MKDKIRVGIIGVGNCASSLVQGIEFYRNANEDEFVPGLMHVNLGGFWRSLTTPSSSRTCRSSA
jgi:myo-inositol-1-phosphate synthase